MGDLKPESPKAMGAPGLTLELNISLQGNQDCVCYSKFWNDLLMFLVDLIFLSRLSISLGFIGLLSFHDQLDAMRRTRSI